MFFFNNFFNEDELTREDENGYVEIPNSSKLIFDYLERDGTYNEDVAQILETICYLEELDIYLQEHNYTDNASLKEEFYSLEKSISLAENNQFLLSIIALSYENISNKNKYRELYTISFKRIVEISKIYINYLYTQRNGIELPEYLQLLNIVPQSNEYKILSKLQTYESWRHGSELVRDDEFTIFCERIESNPSYLYEIKNKCKNYVFLSHSYKDRFLAYLLFDFFKKHDVFLYVDWMHNSKINETDLLKSKLQEEIYKSNQLLFLDTMDSNYALTVDIHKLSIGKLKIQSIKTNSVKQEYISQKKIKEYQVRQYCAWEIGVFYDSHLTLNHKGRSTCTEKFIFKNVKNIYYPEKNYQSEYSVFLNDRNGFLDSLTVANRINLNTKKIESIIR